VQIWPPPEECREVQSLAQSQLWMDIPLLALPHREPPDKTGVVLLNQLLTAFCDTATKSVLTHFLRGKSKLFLMTHCWHAKG